MRVEKLKKESKDFKSMATLRILLWSKIIKPFRGFLKTPLVMGTVLWWYFLVRAPFQLSQPRADMEPVGSLYLPPWGEITAEERNSSSHLSG